MLKERGNPKEGALFISSKGERLTVRFINTAMKSLFSKAFPEKHFLTKSLRDSYNSALLRANLTQEIKDLLFGHKRSGAKSSYSYDVTTILEAYEKAFSCLSINGGTMTRVTIKRMEDTVIGLSEIIKTQNDEIVKLKTIIEQNGLTLNRMNLDFNNRLDWLETKLNKKEKVQFT